MKEQNIVFKEKYGEVHLESPEMNLKLTTDRALYIKKPADKQFSRVGTFKTPEGMSKEQKMIWLIKYRESLIEELTNNPPKKTNEEESDEKI